MSGYTVIGAAGFIGSRVVERLRATGRDVFAPGRDNPELFARDLGRVVYCAGLTGDYRTRPFDAVAAHVTLLADILDRARFERIVYLSSTRVYDALADGDGREDRAIPVDASDPRHIYELSKLLGENLTVNQSQGRGCAARLSYVFDASPGAEGFLSEWLQRAREGREIVLDSSPSFARDYIHRDDVVEALIAMVDSDAVGVVNVASGEALSNAEIAAVFARRGWTVGFTRPPAEASPLICDTARLSALGVRPRAVRALIDDYLATLD